MTDQPAGSAELAYITRPEILELCTRLGHDPNKVSRLIIDPTGITVEYLHPIVEQTEPTA